MSDKKKFYITTAIAYTSRKPHIGNAYDIVLADMIARYKKMMGFDVFLMTGSDEHGQKIEEYAKAAGISPKEYVDNVSGEIKGVWDSLNTSYDKFIRTTDEDHEKVVAKIFKKLYEQGDIYKSTYEGKYCVPCESFFTSSQLVDGKCPDCGREVIDSKEEAYFLRLSKYQDKLMEYYEQNPDFIKPESRKNEMINNFLKPGLSDLCVSRSSFKWGVPVPFDEGHVIYVWIDALSNYITGIGYDPDGSSEQYNKLWPADLHVIGKDIVRFHTIYWPIILMALGLPLPKQVLGHPWVLVGEDKMSKSKGNVIYADDLAKRFGIDAVRYYLLSEIPFTQDGTITYESFITKFNADLANTLGNLVNRSIAMTNKYFGGTVKAGEITEDCDKDLIATAEETIKNYYAKMDSYHNADACETVMNLAKRCNKYIDETTPWALAKDEANKPRLEAVLYNLLECIRLLGIMLSPIIPDSCNSIKTQLNCNNTELKFGAVGEYSVDEATPLFARLDMAKVLEEIAAEKDAEKKAETPENVATLAEISIEDFAKIELKAAKITACEPVPKAKKLLKLTLDDGSGKERTVASGIAKWYKPEDLIGHTVIVVANLKPAKLCGVESQGMILAADCADDDVKVVFIDGVPAGSKIR
ncbi:MAG: methionine--tRNA ligase [Acutalibacteraceae bacterium]|nr:methionine--tRNA ligase [Acutalibacteraceae bacterium]